jgi:membrane protease YdiL (CAAX protease family)
VVFVALLTALSVPFYVLGAFVGEAGVGSMELSASALMFVAPAVAAIILVRRRQHDEGVSALLCRIISRPDPRLRWWAIALLTVPVITLFAGLAVRVLGDDQGAVAVPVSALPVVAAIFLVSAACEELGWSAYLTDALTGARGIVTTGVMVGVAWAVWHLVPLLQVGHGAAWLAGWAAMTVASRMIIVWLYVSSAGSLPYAIVFHASMNVCAAYTSGTAASMIASGAVTSALAIGLAVALARRRPIDRRRAATPSA